MAISDLTSRDAVLATLQEFDALGREAFLEKYGFGPARDWFIRRDDKRYDSKAVVGVAYGKQFPDRGTLKHDEFKSGEATVARVLEHLGFNVFKESNEEAFKAWIFQANPTLYDLQGALQNLTDFCWLVKQHRDDIKLGDTVYLWEGEVDAGIVAIATVSGEPAMRNESVEEAVFNREPTKFAGEQLRATLHIEQVLEERISRTKFRNHPILKNMTILRAPQATNFALSVDESRALDSLLSGGTMALTIEDLRAMMSGFATAGFRCSQEPTGPRNPVSVEWHTGNETRRYRLWAFDITHGGGGPNVRAADEFRIQITNGPENTQGFDSNGAIDLLVGYSRNRDAIVAYDRRWLENWSSRKQQTGSGGSPSVQIKEADIQAGHDNGIHHTTKSVNFGEADIVTMSPAMLPAYLVNHAAVLQGTMTPTQVEAAIQTSNAATVVDYCKAQGFPFEPDLIARYLAALLTKPFVILAGVSGTGKSKLPELVAEFYTATIAAPAGGATPAAGEGFVFVPNRGAPDPTRFALVAVRPDWIDNQSILGFVNPITEQYESTQALDLILRADRVLATWGEKLAAPRYFMLLDEMNLARVEHYFSDWLACTESRRLRPDGSISQQPVALHRATKMATKLAKADGTSEDMAVPAALTLPTNLIVTGTVNVDETTYGFSPKVLDRAMVLEFDEVDLERLRSGGGDFDASEYRFPESLPPFRLATGADYAALPSGAHEHFKAINAILEEARLHLGYRAANEIALFMAIYRDLTPDNPTDTEWLQALDAAILQKVLPRLSGNRAKLEAPLANLCAYLRDLVRPPGDVGPDNFDRTAPARLPKAYRRAVEMLEALGDFGFVSFFK